MRDKPVLKVENLSKRYRIGANKDFKTKRSLIVDALKSPLKNYHNIKGLASFNDLDDDTVFWALKDINFELSRGDILGIMGPNGSGKSTLLKILSRIIWSTSGQFSYSGRLASLLEVGTGFNGELTGRDNIYLNGSILGMKKNEIDNVLDEIIDFSGVEKFIDTPVKRYSSGMTVRLAFSVAAHLDPDILLLDEVLSVGDAQFSQKSIEKMENVALSGRTVIFVSHSVTAVEKLCKRGIMLNAGRIAIEGSVSEITGKYLGEYTSTRTKAEWLSNVAPEEPGLIRLLSVSVRDENNKNIGLGDEEGARLDIRKGVLIEVSFDILAPDKQFLTEVRFSDDQDRVLFTAVEPPNRKPNIGLNKSTLIIPGNFFSEGKLFVSVGFITASPHQSFLLQKNLLYFDVFDPQEGDSVKSYYGSDVAGLIRPLLTWR